MKIEKLENRTFVEYGDVLEVAGSGFNANQGTAKRFNHLTALINNRVKQSNNDLNNPEAKLNCCIFRVTPASLPFNIK
jgi:ureidoglycolate hydrolase